MLTKFLGGAAVLAIAGVASAGGQQVREGVTAGGIAYEVRGTGPAVVLITGSNLDRRVWDPQLATLSGDFTVVRYDLRAHGRSAPADGPFSGAGDLGGLLDELALRDVTLVGLSYGCRVAVDYALAHPEQVRAMVLASPTVSGYTPTERPAWLEPMIQALRAGDADRAAAVLATSPVMAVGPADSAWVRRMVRENAGLFRQTGRETPPPAPAWDRLAELTMPLLVVTGADDAADILRVADALVSQARNARRVRVAGVAHLVNVAGAAEFNSALGTFLDAR